MAPLARSRVRYNCVPLQSYWKRRWHGGSHVQLLGDGLQLGNSNMAVHSRILWFHMLTSNGTCGYERLPASRITVRLSYELYGYGADS